MWKCQRKNLRQDVEDGAVLNPRSRQDISQGTQHLCNQQEQEQHSKGTCNLVFT